MITNISALDYITIMSNNWEFNNNDVYIAKKIVENYHDIPTYSLDMLIEILHVSKQTFKKFYEQLGYQSYSEFKEDIIFGLGIKKKQFLDRYHSFGIEKNITMYQQIMTEKIDLEIVDVICEEIHRAKRLVFYGTPVLLTKAIDFQLDMQIFGKVVITSSTNDSKIVIPTEGDLLCICSETGKVFKVYKTLMKNKVLASDNKKIFFGQEFVFNEDIDYVVETKTINNYYEMQYIYLFYLNLIVMRYYERYKTEI